MRLIIRCAIAIVVTVSFAITALPAQAQVPPVPDDVAAWFQQQGQAIARTQSLPSSGATPDPDSPLMFPVDAVVGNPIPVMVWDDAFLDAQNPTIDMLIPRGDWMAPIGSHGQGVGTMTAFKIDAGGLTCGWDTNAQLADALLAATPDDVLVSDGMHGIFIVTNNTVRQYDGWSSTPAVGTLKQLQVAVVEQNAASAAQVAARGGQGLTVGGSIDFGAFVQTHSADGRPLSSPWRPVLLTVGLPLLVICLAAITYVVHRRRKVVSG